MLRNYLNTEMMEDALQVVFEEKKLRGFKVMILAAN
jgi:hypothetical protein